MEIGISYISAKLHSVALKFQFFMMHELFNISVLALVNWMIMNAIKGTINLKDFHSGQQLEFKLQHF